MATSRTVADKARVQAGTRIAVLNGVAEVVDSLGLPADVTYAHPRDAQLVFLFVNSRDELESRMPPTVELLGPEAAIWVFFRRGSRAAGLDMNRNDIWAIAESRGMRPLGLLRVDETWSISNPHAVSDGHLQHHRESP